MTSNNDTSIYMYNFYGNWVYHDKEFLKKVPFDALYLGDMEYKHYNYFIDEDEFLKDNIIFALLSEEKCSNYEDTVERLQECKQLVTSYDATHYTFGSEIDEMIAEGGKKTMFVFTLTDKYKHALEQLKLSKFSKMYELSMLSTLFSNHQDYLIKYSSKTTTIKIDMKNVDTLLDNISLEKELPNFKFSYFHILNKTPELKALLEKIFLVNLNTDSELKHKIRKEREIYNYEKVMNEELLT